MSRLQLFGRPWVVFDVENKQHRKWFAEFQKSGTWGRCPVRFVVNDDHGDLLTMIQRELIQYYVSKEFNFEGSSRRIGQSHAPLGKKSLALI